MSNKQQTIALHRLTAWKGNVRKTGPKEGLEELVASISAHGLLQSLIVRETPDGNFAVVAGRRRLMALKLLAKTGKLAPDFPVPCHVVAGEADASEISLAENVVRVAMHPADQFEAFRTVIDNGATVAYVAARFGVSEDMVEKRLKLGRPHPSFSRPTARTISVSNRRRLSRCPTTMRRRKPSMPGDADDHLPAALPQLSPHRRDPDRHALVALRPGGRTIVKG